jgi:hypothetical protein
MKAPGPCQAPSLAERVVPVMQVRAGGPDLARVHALAWPPTRARAATTDADS